MTDNMERQAREIAILTLASHCKKLDADDLEALASLADDTNGLTLTELLIGGSARRRKVVSIETRTSAAANLYARGRAVIEAMKETK